MKHLNPVISVVTVCRNPGELLKATVRSVAEQTAREEIEFVVVDGASTDSTPDFLRGLPEGTVDRWVSEPDGGIYDAMNKGVKLSRGEWIIFMNAGDTFSSPDVCEKLIAVSDEDAGVVYGDVRKRDRVGCWQVKKAEPPHNSHRMFFCHQSSMTRRRLLEEYPFDTTLRMSADFKFFKTLILNGIRFQYIPISVSDFDTTGVSNSRRADGLRENLRVVSDLDRGLPLLRHRLHLLIPLLSLRARR